MTVTELWRPLSSKIFKCPKKITPISYGSGRLPLAERARTNCDSDASGKNPIQMVDMRFGKSLAVLLIS